MSLTLRVQAETAGFDIPVGMGVGRLRIDIEIERRVVKIGVVLNHRGGLDGAGRVDDRTNGRSSLTVSVD